MRRHSLSGFRFIVPVLLALAASLSGSSAQEVGRALRVLCYNIHYGQGNDGEYDLARLAEVIKATKPDLVGLQEVDVGVRRSGKAHQVLRLAELTGMAARYGPTQHYEGGLFGNAVLTRLHILDVAIHPLPYTEATPEKTTYPRGAIAVTVRAPDGQPLRFISTHFQHNVEEDRVAEAHAINELFAKPGDTLRTILAGDLNAKPDAEPIRVLEERWINALDPVAAPTAPSHKPVSRIDYILSRPEAAFRLVSSQVVPDDMASDHQPVLAVFELTGKK
ncbi:MAG TPA: endonuclease [Verrucomicrobiales bacterium]|nr:endonuclease [Verrucomicrobiales bacterium]